MVGAVDELDLDVDDREAGEDAGLHRLRDAGVDRRDVLPRDRAADDLVLELVAGARLVRRHVDHDVAVLAAAAGLADELPRARPGPACGWSRGRRPAAADVGVDLELAHAGGRR